MQRREDFVCQGKSTSGAGLESSGRMWGVEVALAQVRWTIREHSGDGRLAS